MDKRTILAVVLVVIVITASMFIQATLFSGNDTSQTTAAASTAETTQASTNSTELTEEKDQFEADFNRDQAQIKELDRNPKAIEKIARERYFMKADDEDIFVLSDDDRDVKPLETNERVE